MVTRIQANAAMKAEMKSFEMCVTMLISMASLPDVKKYLAEREITVAYLKQKSAAKTLVCKAQLMNYCTLYEFTAKNGSTYKAIGRKDKSGKIVEANWSIWRVLCAIDKMYMAKQEAKTIKEAIEGKKASVKAIEKTEAKAKAEEAKREEVRAEGKAKREESKPKNASKPKNSAASLKAKNNKAKKVA